MFKNYPYTDTDGNHWPDGYQGSELYYSLDFSSWVSNESDTLVSIDWEVPPGVTEMDAFTGNGVAHIKLSLDSLGTFKIKCVITTTESEKEQIIKVPMMLKVY